MNYNDHYAKKAKNESFAARSVYKLEEIQKKYHIIKKNMKIMDLGCAPGSWMQYTSGILGTTGFLLGIDIKPVGLSLGSNVNIVEKDIFLVEPQELLAEYGEFDGVLSDMAPSTTGNRDHDHFGSMELCERAFQYAEVLLKNGGFFVCKMFDGEDSPEFIKRIRPKFTFFKALRPQATKKASREVFLTGTGYKK